MAEPRPLTPKQQRFVDEYLIDLNATQAAIRAGYSVSRAEVTGSELVRNRKVADAIAELRRPAVERLQLTAEDVARRAWAIAQQDKPDRVAALSLIAKYTGGFTDKQEPAPSYHQHLHLEGLTLDELRRLAAD